MQAVSVSDLTDYLSVLFDSDENLHDLWVQGEISQIKTTPRGFTYMTIKGDNAQLDCTAFRPVRNSASLRNGQMVQVHGRMSIYKAGGKYNLNFDMVELVQSLGAMYEELQRLKAALEAEGLFDDARKRPLPEFPKRIGVVTSADTAAFQDVLNVLRRRFPLVEVVLSHATVQGNDAPPQIVRAIQRLVKNGQVDVILVCRGGGSTEDLWCFNDERIVRAIAASPITVITGVGHETDTTLVDFVADVRAPTPSAAAEMLTPDAAQLRADVLGLNANIASLGNMRLNERRNQLKTLQKQLSFYAIEQHLDNQRQRIDELLERMTTTATRAIALRRERTRTQLRLLDAADPQQLLTRGYAIVTRTHDGSLVSRTRDTSLDTHLSIRLQDGTLGVRIEDITQETL